MGTVIVVKKPQNTLGKRPCFLALPIAAALLPDADAHRGLHDKVVQRKPHRVPQLGGRRSSAGTRYASSSTPLASMRPSSDTKAYIELVAEASSMPQAALGSTFTGEPCADGAGRRWGQGGGPASIPSKYASLGWRSRSRHLCAVAPTSQTCADGNTLRMPRIAARILRPTAPLLATSRCAPSTTPGRPSINDEDFHTALHEILHIMGWSSALFPFSVAVMASFTPRCGDPSDSRWLPAGAKAYATDQLIQRQRLPLRCEHRWRPALSVHCQQLDIPSVSQHGHDENKTAALDTAGTSRSAQDPVGSCTRSLVL